MATFKNRYTVKNVPWYWYLPMELYGWTLALGVYLYTGLVCLTSRVSYGGQALAPGQNYIYCFWHESVFAYMCLRHRYDDLALFVHPVWYMRPTHLMGYLKGVRRIVYGSTGNNGRASAEELAGHLRGGDSCFFTPDGPYGPLRQLKKGCLYVAAETGVPIVGMTITSSRCIRFNGWDHKVVPLPFGRLHVDYGEPFTVEQGSIEAAAQRLALQLDGEAAAAGVPNVP